MRQIIFMLSISLALLMVGCSSMSPITIYGEIPTSNPNMKWENNNSYSEKYTGVIQLDTSIYAGDIIDAFISTFQPLQDANIMTKQMRTNNAIGGALSAFNGDYKSMKQFGDAGESDSRRQYGSSRSWTVQFIDGVRLTRFYYNVNVQAKQGRYKLSVIPSGLSGYAQDHIQTEWRQIYRDGMVKSMYINYHSQMKIKLATTINEWIKNVDQQLNENSNF